MGYTPLSMIPPRRGMTRDERVDEVKQAYVDGIIDINQLEEDVAFVLDGGTFAGSYVHYVDASRIRPPTREVTNDARSEAQ